MESTRSWKLLFLCVSLPIIILTIVAYASQGNAETGEYTFYEHCAESHGDKGDGQGPIGPYLEGEKPTILLDEKTRARSDQELFEIIRYGVHIEMPSWEGILDDQDILNVITFLRILAPALRLAPG
ncbi:MAG: c-type cytochrome [Nitrospirales bacterium]